MRAARHVGRLQDGLVEPNQSATFVEDTWPSQSQTRADPEPNNRRWGCRQRDTLEQQCQIITVSEMGREVKTSILMKLAPKQMHMCLQLDTARLNTCEAQDEIESFAFAIESVQNPDVAPMELDAINHRGKGKLSSVQNQKGTDRVGKSEAPLKGKCKDSQSKHNKVRTVGPCQVWQRRMASHG